MPMYTFYCKKCKKEEDQIVSFSTLEVKCVHCGGTANKQNVIYSSGWDMEGGTNAQSTPNK